MAILNLSFLLALSCKSATELLLQEGYVEEQPREKPSPACDRKFIYPYALYDSTGKQLDCIFYVEYCNQVIDDEYLDGRMSWKVSQTKWTREGVL